MVKILQAALLGVESGVKRRSCLRDDSKKLQHESATGCKMRNQQVRSHTDLVDWRAMNFVLENYLRWLEKQRSVLYIRAMECNSSRVKARDAEMRAGLELP